MKKVLDHIENLRQKPESHRRRVQFFVSVGTALLILVIWGVVFTINAKPEVALNENREENLDSPLDVIRDDLSASVEQVRDGYVILKNGGREE